MRFTPCGLGSPRSTSVKPSFSSTRSEAVFQSHTSAHSRGYPFSRAQSTTASAASVA